MTNPAAILALHLRARGIPFVQEHRFCERRWRFDFVLLPIERRVAAEVHGATWVNGRHTRGAGFAKDREKINHAQMLGWNVYEFTTEMVESGYAVGVLERVVLARGEATK